MSLAGDQSKRTASQKDGQKAPSRFAPPPPHGPDPLSPGARCPEHQLRRAARWGSRRLFAETIQELPSIPKRPLLVRVRVSVQPGYNNTPG